MDEEEEYREESEGIEKYKKEKCLPTGMNSFY